MFNCLKYSKPLSKALIIHGGALGDCILTLRIADFLRNELQIDSISFIGQGEYIGFMPGRTAIDRIRNINSLRIEQLFAPSNDFEIEDNDNLINIFSGYDWIISFLGEKDSDFEANLAYTACITSSPELVIIPPKAPQNWKKHISCFYLEYLFNEKLPSIEAFGIEKPHSYLQAAPKELVVSNVNDIQAGLNIIKSQTDISIRPSTKIAVICPGSGAINKCWHTENFIDLAKRMKRSGFTPVYLLGNAELERFDDEKLDKLGNVAAVVKSLTIEEVVGLLSISAICIGNDSGIGHLSGAMGIPTISIFGITNPNLYKPIGSNSNAIQLDMSEFAEYNQAAVEKIIQSCLSITDN